MGCCSEPCCGYSEEPPPSICPKRVNKREEYPKFSVMYTDLLSALLLGEHLLFLRDDFCLVLQTECERKSDQ